MAAGAVLEEVIVYRHQDIDAWPPEIRQRLVAGNLDWIGVSSPAIARNVWRLIPNEARQKLGQEIRIASISPVTSAACREIGLPVSAEATEFTWKGIVAAIQNSETETLAEFRLG
jgi:uroporphyrinogen III methyltransferase/synthase